MEYIVGYFFVEISSFLNTFRKKLSNKKAINCLQNEINTIKFKRQGILAKGSADFINNILNYYALNSKIK